MFSSYCTAQQEHDSLYAETTQDDTSGDYKRTLLNLCGGDDE